MLETVDHVGYLVRDLDSAAATMCKTFGFTVFRRFERPQFILLGVYLGVTEPGIELFTLTDSALVERRLGGADALLDHTA